MVFNYIFFPVGATSSSCSFCLQQNPFSLHIYLLPGTQLQYWKVCVFVERLLALVSHFCQELLYARVVEKKKYLCCLYVYLVCLCKFYRGVVFCVSPRFHPCEMSTIC